jgi:hypothetical protein
MGYYIDPQGNYPRHAGDVQAEVPEWNEETDALPEGWLNVQPGTVPEILEGQQLVELAPKLVKGKYVRQFTTEAIPEPAPIPEPEVIPNGE